MLATLLNPLLRHLHQVADVHAGTVHGLQSATVHRRGPDGVRPAEVITADYSRLQRSASGGVQGGTVSFNAHYRGAHLSQSQAQFGPEGRPSVVRTTLFDRYAGGVHRMIEADFGKLAWTEDRVHAGDLHVAVHDAHQAPLADVVLRYAAEVPVQAHITQYGPGGTGASSTTGTVAMDLSSAHFLGPELTGGTMHVTVAAPDGTMQSTTDLHLDEFGCPHAILVTGFRSDGTTVRDRVHYKYDQVAFNPLREVESGTLTLLTQDPGGTVRAHTDIAYQNGLPSSFRSERRGADGQVKTISSIDYSGASFNNDKRVINGAVHVDVTRPDGATLRTVDVEHDGAGLPASSSVVGYDADGAVAYRTQVDYSNAVYDRARTIVGGTTTTTTTVGDVTRRTLKTYGPFGVVQSRETHVLNAERAATQPDLRVERRPDGTLLSVTKTTQNADGTPHTGTVTKYGPDGATVTSVDRIDYSGASFDGKDVVGGVVSIQSRDGRNRLRAESTAQFGAA